MIIHNLVILNLRTQHSEEGDVGTVHREVVLQVYDVISDGLVTGERPVRGRGEPGNVIGRRKRRRQRRRRSVVVVAVVGG